MSRPTTPSTTSTSPPHSASKFKQKAANRATSPPTTTMANQTHHPPQQQQQQQHSRCDRRQSRAARDLVREHLVASYRRAVAHIHAQKTTPTIGGDKSSFARTEPFSEEWNVWQLLDHFHALLRHTQDETTGSMRAAAGDSSDTATSNNTFINSKASSTRSVCAIFLPTFDCGYEKEHYIRVPIETSATTIHSTVSGKKQRSRRRASSRNGAIPGAVHSGRSASSSSSSSSSTDNHAPYGSSRASNHHHYQKHTHAVSTTATPANGPQQQPLYQCGACQKTFTSPYYLDRHMDNTHYNHNGIHSTADSSAESLPPPHDDFYDFREPLPLLHCHCPATDWCHSSFLTPWACADHALLLEPFYGPGSNGRSGDATTVATRLQNTERPQCRNDEWRATRIRCESLVQTCFASSSSKRANDTTSLGVEPNNNSKTLAEWWTFYLIQDMCREEGEHEPLQDDDDPCHRRRQRSILSAATASSNTKPTSNMMMMMYPYSQHHHLHWDVSLGRSDHGRANQFNTDRFFTSVHLYSDHYDHHRLGWWGMFVVVIVAAFYGQRLWSKSNSHHNHSRGKNTVATGSPQPPPLWPWNSASGWTWGGVARRHRSLRGSDLKQGSNCSSIRQPWTPRPETSFSSIRPSTSYIDRTTNTNLQNAVTSKKSKLF